MLVRNQNNFHCIDVLLDTTRTVYSPSNKLWFTTCLLNQLKWFKETSRNKFNNRKGDNKCGIFFLDGGKSLGVGEMHRRDESLRDPLEDVQQYFWKLYLCKNEEDIVVFITWFLIWLIFPNSFLSIREPQSKKKKQFPGENFFK